MHGISSLSSIPVRVSPAETAEMSTQILFGECYTVIETTEKWLKVCLAHDNYEGWIDAKMTTEISAQLFLQLTSSQPTISQETINVVQELGHYKDQLIVAGSTLHGYNKENNEFEIANKAYKLHGQAIHELNDQTRQNIASAALRYYNAPYLWGGRTPLGIDCSGLVQNVYRMVGIDLPRDASQQAHLGTHFSFIEEAEPGDLAFFDNEEGKITHVGIIWEKNKIIHASGSVRIDSIDHQGIFNLDRKRYSHKLRLLKKIIE